MSYYLLACHGDMSWSITECIQIHQDENQQQQQQQQLDNSEADDDDDNEGGMISAAYHPILLVIQEGKWGSMIIVSSM